MPNTEKIILVVEDEKPLLEAIKMKLEKHGFSVVTARSCEQAKNHILDIKKIDAIWVDHYLLGKENGLDFIFWCKTEMKNFKKTPIFVVSNTASSDKVKQYMMLGVKKYYVKAEKQLGDIIEEIKKAI
jgi:DNA-binding response OmpR family regulator